MSRTTPLASTVAPTDLADRTRRLVGRYGARRVAASLEISRTALTALIAQLPVRRSTLTLVRLHVERLERDGYASADPNAPSDKGAA
jgi:hypothetical protein